MPALRGRRPCEDPGETDLAVTYRIDPQERIVYLNVTGQSSFDEWQAAMERVLADPAYLRRFNFLTDRRGQIDVPEPEFARKVLRFLVARTLEMGRYRWAAVSNTEATFTALRMFSVLAEEADIRVEVFRDFDAARRWLMGGEGDPA